MSLSTETAHYDKKSGMVICRSKPHATLKRDYLLMLALGGVIDDSRFRRQIETMLRRAVPTGKRGRPKKKN